MRSLLMFMSVFCLLYSCSDTDNNLNQNSKTQSSENRSGEVAKGPEDPLKEDCCDLLFITESILSFTPGGCCRKQITFTNNSKCSMTIVGQNTSFVLGPQSVATRQVKSCPGFVTYFSVQTADGVLCRKYPVHSCQQSYICPSGGISLQWSSPLRPESYCTNVQVNIDSLTGNYLNCRIKKIEFTYNKVVGNVKTPVFNTHVYQLGVTPNLALINQSQYPNDDIVPNNVTTDFLGNGDCFVLENLALPGEIYTLEVCYKITLDCTECPPITGCKTYTIACE